MRGHSAQSSCEITILFIPLLVFPSLGGGGGGGDLWICWKYERDFVITPCNCVIVEVYSDKERKHTMFLHVSREWGTDSAQFVNCSPLSCPYICWFQEMSLIELSETMSKKKKGTIHM
jgi:hypothetical protein